MWDNLRLRRRSTRNDRRQVSHSAFLPIVAARIRSSATMLRRLLSHSDRMLLSIRVAFPFSDRDDLPMNDPDSSARTDALTKLKDAQQMIEEGRAELVNAPQKILTAQKLIDESAAVLRETWKRREG